MDHRRGRHLRPLTFVAIAAAVSMTAPLAGCSCKKSGAALSGAEAPVRRYQGAGFEGIVVVASGIPPHLYGERDEGYWTPDDATLSRFEAGLAAYLRASPPPRSPKLHEKYAPYHRRYVGKKVGGANKLYVTFYCPREAAWDQPFLAVADGGDCYFHILYDVGSGAYEWTAVNGTN